MSLALLLQGAVIGFSIAAPVGPIGALTIRRTLAQGRAAGLATGIGAASADAVYGAVAAFGLSAVTNALIAQAGWLRLLGGAFLVYLGAKTFVARASAADTLIPASGLAAAYSSTFLLTLANPTTILSFIAVFAGLGLAGGQDTYARAALFVGGVFVGSALWWVVLSWSVARLRSRMSPEALRWVNRTSGAVIAAFGVLALSAAM
jgi:threonine/homoserine/homoserine lactone efflux protein